MTWEGLYTQTFIWPDARTDLTTEQSKIGYCAASEGMKDVLPANDIAETRRFYPINLLPRTRWDEMGRKCDVI